MGNPDTGAAGLRGVLGVFGCHPTSLGSEANYYSSDWCGRAKTAAGEVFASAKVGSNDSNSGNDRPIIGFIQGCCGDISPLPLCPVGTPSGLGPMKNRTKRDDRPAFQGRELREAVGRRVGEAAGQIALSAFGKAMRMTNSPNKFEFVHVQTCA